MVINDFNILGACQRPAEADAKLIVYADAVLAFTSAAERFEPVAGRHPQIVQLQRDLQLPQFSARDGFNIHESPDWIASGEGRCIGASEGNDH